MTNSIELNFETNLEIRINNSKPIELTSLTMSLLAVGHQYASFIESETNKEYEARTELYIKDVRSGSVVIELVANSLPLVPLLWTGGSLSEWVNYTKSTMEWLTGKISSPPKELTKKHLAQWDNIIDPIAKDHGSQMNISAKEGNVTINQYIINSNDALAAQERIQIEKNKLDEPDSNTHRMKVMTWYQTKFDLDSETGDRAIIEAISKKPLKVLFENNAVKRAMLEGDAEYNKPWHELAYVVDVDVQTVKGSPKAYTILRVYTGHTFDPTFES